MQHVSFGASYILRLERGEEVIETLTRFVREKGIGGGVISGIGALREITLGYFDPETKAYTKELFEESYEAASLNGTAGRFENESVLHLHATLADAHHHARAGHLFSAVVSATLEVHILRLAGDLVRTRDEFTGLNLLDLS